MSATMPNVGITTRQALAGFNLLGAGMQGWWERQVTGTTTPETNARWTDARDTLATIEDTPAEP